MNKNKNLGFTLAEVLIVIGIIGVVAALTLPNLNHATGDKETVTKVKKIYSALSDAVDRAQAIYGDFDTWFKDLDNEDYETCNKRFANRVTEFMKVSKDCGFDAGCFAESNVLNYIGEDSYGEPSYNGYSVLLNDGIAVGFKLKTLNTNNDEANFQINVDIDGPNKGKNQIGSDLFYFGLYTNEQSASNANTYTNQLMPDCCSSKWINVRIGSYTTAWVIENGNLDYLKTDEDGNCPDGQPLNWETKTSCE